MTSKTITLQFTAPHDINPHFNEEYRAVIEPDNPITKCTISYQIHPLSKDGWSYVASGFSFCRRGDDYDFEKGNRLALRSALRNVKNADIRARFWQLYLTAHPVEKRETESLPPDLKREMRDSLKKLKALLDDPRPLEEIVKETPESEIFYYVRKSLERSFEKSFLRMFSHPTPLEIPRLSTSLMDRTFFTSTDWPKFNCNGAKPEPAAAERKFKVGDKVLSSMYTVLGEGEIVAVDKSEVPYRVRWPDGKIHWQVGEHLTLSGEPPFKVGDRVTHIHKPEWGVGEIVKINRDNPPTTDYFGKPFPEFLSKKGIDNPYLVAFKNYDCETWYCCEENLRRAEVAEVK